MEASEIKVILKKHGLDIAEDAVAMTVRAIFKAIPEIVIATPNKVDDLLVPLITILEPQVLALVDKIDGQEG